MTAPQGIWFVYRSHREGPLGKRVRRVAAPSILAWFQAKIEEARISLTPHRLAEADLGGPVHGLAALFEAAKQHALHTPKSTAALTKMLNEHLHATGHVDDVRADAHSVRVLAGDEDGEVAWFFFDDESQSRLPRNLAYLLHDEPRLPDGAAERPFASAAVPALGPAGEGEGETYACLMTSHGRRSLVGRAAVIQGVRLPELAAHLRRVTPEAADRQEGWPIELRVLRALIDADDTKLAPALRRAAAYPLEAVMAKGDAAHLATGAHDAARAELTAAAEGLAHGGEAARSIVFEGDHAALLAAHVSERAGFDQWILFDDRWAAANSDLATSILHSTEHADPFAALRPTRAPAKPKAEKAAKSGAEKAAKPKADKAERKVKAAEAAKATKDEQAWKTALGDRDVAEALGYRPNARFDKGGLIAHAKFGVGVVTRTEGTKVEVLFRDGPRLLVHGAT